ncbi:MAG: hypothetical protein Tsb002_18680 [Wenzhouxiangellaceae bacterium]
MNSPQVLSIVHRASGVELARGTTGWWLTPFDNSYYIAGRCLRSRHFRNRWIPGLCPYKGLYHWVDWHFESDQGDCYCERLLAWRYWLPNPLLPFIAGRIALPRNHQALDYQWIGETASS